MLPKRQRGRKKRRSRSRTTRNESEGVLLAHRGPGGLGEPEGLWLGGKDKGRLSGIGDWPGFSSGFWGCWCESGTAESVPFSHEDPEMWPASLGKLCLWAGWRGRMPQSPWKTGRMPQFSEITPSKRRFWHRSPRRPKIWVILRQTHPRCRWHLQMPLLGRGLGDLVGGRYVEPPWVTCIGYKEVGHRNPQTQFRVRQALAENFTPVPGTHLPCIGRMEGILGLGPG